MDKNLTFESLQNRVKELEQELKIRSELLDKSIDIIWKLDLKLRFTFVSPSVFETFGYTQDEWIGSTLSSHASPSEFIRMSQKALDSITYYSEDTPFEMFEAVMLRKDGTPIDVEVAAKLVFDTNGLPKELIGSTRDITQRKKAERELREKTDQLKASNAAKDKFFSIVAHDLKNPFSALIGFSSLLQEEVEHVENENIVQFSSIINNTLLRTFDYLNNLLEWSRLQLSQIDLYRSTFNLYKLVHSTVEMLFIQAQTKNLTIRISIPEYTEMYADRKMIQTVLMNLISNAIKYSHKRSEIKIEVDSDDEGVSVYVKDKGIGLSPRMQENMFNIEKSVSTPGTEAETGTGLGLILCKEFIAKNEGSIGVESMEGKGSTFWFKIPHKTKQG
ncbi:PAS domain-containing sensor histidine kinase [Mangrovibacterium diazotrophicum]|uniref:histidine kinase n=1 Tax=Mangrovibacterium diazotrophicum TaxID=1261403 RepID=A0A419W4Y3_9BACT|nr:PAS domain-containing sensor histidine kinase [Mangrovibacterium diazotrophicum]RKD90512.1 PAS domain S-box-containing protein [Mangrovibacterium diazotrophicum]